MWKLLNIDNNEPEHLVDICMNDFTSIIFQFSYVVRSDELKSTNHPLEETFTSNVGIQSYPLSEINQFKMEKPKGHKYSM